MESKTASVLRTLRAEIVSGALPGGSRLKEETIASRFEVSRVPVREALRQLEAEGFVVSEKFRGVSVARASVDSVIELMQIRRQLEILAAQLAAGLRGGTADDLFREVVEQAARPGRPSEPVIEFHHIVARASGNTRLDEMIGRLVQQTAWAFERQTDEALTASVADHAAIASAILRGSPVQAGLLMDEHLSKDETKLRDGQSD